MTTAPIARSWHLVTFAVAAFALVLQLALIISGQNVLEGAGAAVADLERVRRYFCYFTIQSNFLVAVAMLLILRGRSAGAVFRVLRLASLIGITVTGIVAAIALPPAPTYSTLNLICDRLLHIAVPVLTLVGWLTFGPRDRVRRSDVPLTLIWPVLWLLATLALGPVVDWYPYPFLDVGTLGLGQVLVNCVVIALVFVALATLALWADRRLSRNRATMTP